MRRPPAAVVSATARGEATSGEFKFKLLGRLASARTHLSVIDAAAIHNLTLDTLRVNEARREAGRVAMGSSHTT